MKYVLAAVVLAGLCLFSPTAEAQSCAKCWTSLEGNLYCGQTTHSAAESCRLTNTDYCTEVGSCEGMDGPECTRPCVQYRYVDGSYLPEKSPWMVAKVEIVRPQERAKS
jgi:hypothetical protein